MKVYKFKVVILVLVICLAALLILNIYLLFNNSYETSKTRTFVFYNSLNKHIRGSRVEAEITFDWSTSNLTITAKINDNETCRSDRLGLAFDTGMNELHMGWLPYNYMVVLMADNTTADETLGVVIVEKSGAMGWLASTFSFPSRWHYAVFNNESGYFFRFSIPKETIEFKLPMHVYIAFTDVDVVWTYKTTLDDVTATVFWEFEVQ